jgi:FixJ family two-component response regulator
MTVQVDRVDNRNGAVAVVDDDPAVLDSLKFLLEVAGHAVVVYASAVRFLADRTARPSCLIVDQHMPDMTGLELAARLRDDGADIPVMLITGSSSPAIVARAAQLGIERVLEKPPTERELLRFVEAHR